MKDFFRFLGFVAGCIAGGTILWMFLAVVAAKIIVPFMAWLSP